MTTENLTLLHTPDKATIALWTVFNKNLSNQGYILLTHGTFSNKKICLPLAKHLANQGYTCYVMEWRNHGDSPKTKREFNFETIALQDLKTTFNYLLDDLKLTKLHCITHSGGGIALTMLLARHKNYQEKLCSITLFACQAFGASSSGTSKIKLTLSKYATALLGYIPSKLLNLGPHNESYYTMKQWFDWNLKKDFNSTSKKVDYRSKMTNIQTPIYSIAAKGDTFIAPTKGCQRFLESFNNDYNVFKEYGSKTKHLESYNHSRILLSQNAKKEIWPTVINWIQTNNQLHL